MKIQIYDTQGRLVRVLDLGQKPAGHYLTRDKAAYWNDHNDTGKRVDSDAYFYYLEAGDFKATRKLVIQNRHRCAGLDVSEQSEGFAR